MTVSRQDSTNELNRNPPHRSLNRRVIVGFRNALTTLALFCLWLGFSSSVSAQITLGQSQVNSTIGQPLQAIIQVQGSPQDLATLRGRSYRMVQGRVDPVITTSIENSPYGSVIRLGSIVPINEPFVDVVVELVSGTGASTARQFTMLINPAGGFNAPPVTQAVPPRKTGGSVSRRPLSAQAQLAKMDREIQLAKTELAKLQAIVNASGAEVAESPVAKTPTIPPTTTVSPESAPPPLSPPPVVNPAPDVVIPAPASSPPAVPAPSIPSPPPANPPVATPPVATPPVATPPVATPPVALPPLSFPPVVTTPPVSLPVVTTPPVSPPVVSSPPVTKPTPNPPVTPLSPTSSATSPAASDRGLFGLDFLPSMESLGLGFITEEILMATGGLLVLLALFAAVMIVRKKNRGKMDDYDQDVARADQYAGTSDVFSTDAVAQAMPPEETASPSVAKKPGLLSRMFKRGAKAEAMMESDEVVDFAALGGDVTPTADNTESSQAALEESQTSKKKSAKKRPKAAEPTPEVVEDKNSTKIERFVDKAAVEEDDFFSGLSDLSTVKNSNDESTVLLSKRESDAPARVSKADAPTQLKQPEPQSMEEDVLEFSDTITRVNRESATEEEDNPVTTAFTEMLTEESEMPAPKVKSSEAITKTAKKPALSDDSFGDTKSASLMEPASTELSLDDLDFSSEKTMIMPDLAEMVRESDGQAGASADDFSFTLNTNSPTKPRTAVPKVTDEPMMEFNAPKPAVGASKASATALAAPAMVASTAMDDMLGSFDLPDMGLTAMETPSMSAPSAEKPGQAGLSFTATSSMNHAGGMGLDLPDLGAEMISFDSPPAIPPAQSSSKTFAKASSTPSNAGDDLDLSALDLSSIKLD